MTKFLKTVSYVANSRLSNPGPAGHMWPEKHRWARKYRGTLTRYFWIIQFNSNKKTIFEIFLFILILNYTIFECQLKFNVWQSYNY